MSQHTVSNQVLGWLLRALVSLAKRNLADRNRECGTDWPGGQQWHQLVHTSQHLFMRSATAEAGIPHEEYRSVLERYRSSGRATVDLNAIWKEMEDQSREGETSIHGANEPVAYEVIRAGHARYDGRDFYGDRAADNAELAYLRDYKLWVANTLQRTLTDHCTETPAQ